MKTRDLFVIIKLIPILTEYYQQISFVKFDKWDKRNLARSRMVVLYFFLLANGLAFLMATIAKLFPFFVQMGVGVGWRVWVVHTELELRVPLLSSVHTRNRALWSCIIAL